MFEWYIWLQSLKWYHDITDITAPIKVLLPPIGPFWLWQKQYNLSIWTRFRKQSFPMNVATAPPCGGSSYVQFPYQRHSSVPSSFKPLPSMLGLEATGGTDSLRSLESSSSSTTELLFIPRRRALVSQLWHGDFLRHQRGNDAHSLLIIES